MKLKKKFSHNKFIWWYEPEEENEEKGEENIEKRKSKKISRQKNFQTYCKQN